MTTVKHKQRGFSMLQALFLMAVFGFIGLFTLKVGPAYIEYLTIAKIADDTVTDPEIMSQSKSKILSHIDRAYRTNNLWDMKAKETIILKKEKNKRYSLRVKYEKRANLFSNVHVVTVFDKLASTP